MAKIAFEHYFRSKVRAGKSEMFFEKMALDLMGAHKLKEER
jgi:sulfide:quinone oxidoreductase